VFVTETGEPYREIQDQGEPEPTRRVSLLEAAAEFRPPVKRGRSLLTAARRSTSYHREWEAYQSELARWKAAGEDPDASEPKDPSPLPAVRVPTSVLPRQLRREWSGIDDTRSRRRAGRATRRAGPAGHSLPWPSAGSLGSERLTSGSPRSASPRRASG